jgi:hypothetical protein
VVQDQRDAYETGATSAKALRETLEIKLASARAAGTQIEGGEDILLRLQELGETPIQVFGFERDSDVVSIYANMADQVLAGCLVIQRGGR